MQQPTDHDRLEHMLEAAREAIGYASTHDRSDLDRNRMLVHSLVRLLEIIGEAASRVSAERRAALSGIPWSQIVGVRNRLAHGYFDVDLDIVWQIVRNDLPELEAKLSQAL